MSEYDVVIAGDGIALALKHGIEVRELGNIQVHPISTVHGQTRASGPYL